MPDSDPYRVYADARTRIRDAAKWLVTILGSVIVLIIGGGLIANIPNLDFFHILGASVCLISLTALAAFPLWSAIRILVSPFESFEQIATKKEYQSLRDSLDAHLRTINTPELDTVDKLKTKRAEQLKLLNASPAPNEAAVLAVTTELDKLEPKIREVIELFSVRRLEKVSRRSQRILRPTSQS